MQDRFVVRIDGDRQIEWQNLFDDRRVRSTCVFQVDDPVDRAIAERDDVAAHLKSGRGIGVGCRIAGVAQVPFRKQLRRRFPVVNEREGQVAAQVCQPHSKRRRGDHKTHEQRENF